MAEPKENVLMEKIVSLCKRRGFIYQSSEIYGGINGFWDYGPLGAELKRNVKELWWNTMTRLRDDVVGLDATIIMAPQIWRASGHVDTFSDPMCDCLLTKKRFRADQIEPQSGTAFNYVGALDGREVKQIQEYVAQPNWSEEFQLQFIRLLMEDLIAKTPPRVSQQTREQIEKAAILEIVSKHFQTQGGTDYRNRAEMITGLLGGMALREKYSVLIPKGKNPESARKVAREFYKTRSVENALLLGETTTAIENSTRFNPENGSLLTEPRPFNLMFQTYVGPIQSDENIAYLRPETAQAIFAQFKNVLDSSRVKIPFGIAQVGKAFRNEVTPRNFTFRSREFEQMELEFFIKPDEAIEAMHGSVASVPEQGDPGEPQPNWGWQAWHRYWVEERVRFYEGIGLSRDTLGFHVQSPEELAHYARATTDILFKFPFSKRNEKGELLGEELEGIAARSDFDLSQHERFSGKSMGVFDEELRNAWNKLDEIKRKELCQRYYDARLKYLTKSGVTAERAERDAKEDADGLAKGQYIPHVIEPSAGVDRLILALIANAYSEINDPDEKGKSETRVILRFHPRVAPIKVAVLPLLKNKPDLVKKACEIRDMLRPHMNVFYDDAGSIGRRYARMDEAGTPFCVTVDFETFEGIKEGPRAGEKDTITIRYRGNTDEENGKQERITIAQLLPWLLERIQ